jgi:hypothetical protein
MMEVEKFASVHVVKSENATAAENAQKRRAIKHPSVLEPSAAVGKTPHSSGSSERDIRDLKEKALTHGGSGLVCYWWKRP